MDDEEIIKLFFARSEQAIKALDLKYGKTCRAVSFDILHNELDAEECVNDAYLGVWNAVPPQHPNPLRTFLYKIVRNLSVMRYHANTALKRNSAYTAALEEMESCLPSSETVEGEHERRELIRRIESFLDTLTAENRVIFLRRY